MRMGGAKKYIVIAVVVGIIGGLSTVALVNHYAYQTVRAEYSRQLLQEQHERENLFQRSALWYGTIQSVDIAQKTLTVQLVNQFVAAREDVSLVIKVTPETLMA